MNAVYDIVIVGGGMVGATLACALGGSRFKVAVVEQRATVHAGGEFDTRVSAISLASRAVFENLGVWPAMAMRRVARVDAMQVWDETGDGSIEFTAAELGEPELAYIIENSLIQSALVGALERHTNVHWICPAEVKSIQLGGEFPRIELSGGRTLEARLLVGADGAASRVRDAAGIVVDRLGLQQESIVATVRTSHAHSDVARQKFLTTGPLAFLPLAEPHHCSIVWSADTPVARELQSLDDAGFIQRLQTAFGDVLGEIALASRRMALPLALSHARAYVSERVALVGDAAHTVHPLAGQGVNLGILDAVVLASELRSADGRAPDAGARRPLRRYERARKADNLAMIGVTGGFRYVFGNRLPVLAPVRNAALNLVNECSPIKSVIMRRAAGLDGELPALARRSRA